MSRKDPLAVTMPQLSRAMRWPIGTAVTVTKDHGEQVATVTRSAPWKLGDTWVILLDGISGGYALARVVERAEVMGYPRHERGVGRAQDGATDVEACEGGAPHDVCSHGTPFVMGRAFGLRGEPE